MYSVGQLQFILKRKSKKYVIWNAAMVLVCLCSNAHSSLHNLKWNTLSLKHKWVKLTPFWHIQSKKIDIMSFFLSCHTCKFTVSLTKHKLIFNLSGIYRIFSNIGDNYMIIEWIAVAVCVVYVLNRIAVLVIVSFHFPCLPLTLYVCLLRNAKAALQALK